MHSSVSTNDAELLRQFLQTRDDRILNALMDRYLPLVYSVALRVSGSPEIASEVAQDVFLKLIELPNVNMKKGTPLIAWLHRTARSRAIDRVRSEKARKVREAEAAFAMDRPQEALSDDGISLLDEVIHQLPAHERELVLQRYFLGRTLGAIGLQAGLSEDAVRMRLKRSLDKMRSMFGDRGISTTAAILASSMPLQAIVAPPAGLLPAIKAKVLAGAATGTSMAGFSPLLYLMTTTQKCIAGATVLSLAGIVATVIATSRHHAEKAEALPPPVARGDTPVAAGNPVQSGTVPRNRGPEDDLYSELRAKYGDTRTRLAVDLAKRSAPLLQEMIELQFSKEFAAQRQAMQNRSFEQLGEILALSPEQAESIQGLIPAYDEQEKEQADRLAAVTRGNPDSLAETFLALDAWTQGEIPDEEFNEITKRTSQALSAGNTNVIEALGLVSVGMASPDPLRNYPNLSTEFEKSLDAEQVDRYRDLRDRNDAAFTMHYEKITIDKIASMIEGMNKMIDAQRTLLDSGER